MSNCKLPRYRMKMHEKLDFGRCVNACHDKDVSDLEDSYRSVKEKLEDLETQMGSILDAFDDLPNDIKNEIKDEPLGWILEKKLQETDLLYNTQACPECGADPGCNIDCHTCLSIAKRIEQGAI